jgi:ABC-2 type transport system ATP-binding protein
MRHAREARSCGPLAFTEPLFATRLLRFSILSESLAIEAHDLRKSYGEVKALCGVDLRAPAGTVLGLLGPNGAGKTTAVRILTTLLAPDGGTAQVAGFDVVRDAPRLRAHIGLAGQYAAVDENLTGKENLEMVGRLYHLGRPRARARAQDLLARFDLLEAGGRVVRTFSGGMRRRLDLAAALVAQPQVLFLDEPTTGLDPRSRLGLWETVEDCVAAGTTVLLTTQYLDEVDRLADRIAVIDHGRVIAEGAPDELKERVGGEWLEIKLEATEADAATAALAELGDGQPTCEHGVLRVPIRRRRGVIADAVRRLDEAGVGIDDIAVRRPTLDDVFLVLTGHAAEEEEGSEERVREEAVA